MKKVLYHGSYNGGIKKFKPRVVSTPNGREMPPSVYATDILAYAVAFGFPWSSNEDHVELSFNGPKVRLQVPEAIWDRIQEKVYVYVLDPTQFELIPDAQPYEHNFVTQESVEPLDVIEFESVEVALKALGSEVIKI